MSEVKKKSTRNIWSAAQMQLLFELWADKIIDLRGVRKNSHVIEEMRITFEEHGFSVPSSEIKTRIHNLTARYRKEKSQIGPSGGAPSKWPYFSEIHKILGNFRINNVSEVVQESIFEDDALAPEDTNEEWLEESINVSEIPPTPTPSSSRPRSPTASSSAPAAKKKKLVQQHILEEVKKSNEIIEAEFERLRATDERIIELEEERNTLLKEMNENTKAFNDAFITMLSKMT
ncbi:uncharacterized protein LOC134216524 [Armigeres subalbatus]|uniref:uncharacterized protein LOC134216524 n=1 Tax=Armigeres subalbatus TaxID=124917 RepID=UPI002ED15B39